MSERAISHGTGWPGKICLCPGVGRFYRRRSPAPRALPLPNPRLPAQRGDTPLSRARPTLHPAWAGLGGLEPPPVAQAFAGARREGLPGPGSGSSLQSPLGAAACAADVCALSGCVCSRARSCVCLRASLYLCAAAWPPWPSWSFLSFMSAPRPTGGTPTSCGSPRSHSGAPFTAKAPDFLSRFLPSVA